MTPKQSLAWDRLYDVLKRAGDDDPQALADLEAAVGALDGLVTQRGLARVLQCTTRHVRALVANGRIPEVRIGGVPRYDLPAVKAALGS